MAHSGTDVMRGDGRWRRRAVGALGAPEVALNSCSELSVVNGGKHSAVGELSGSGGNEIQFVLQFANPLLSILEGAHLFIRKTGESLLGQHLDLLVEYVQKLGSEGQGRSAFHSGNSLGLGSHIWDFTAEKGGTQYRKSGRSQGDRDGGKNRSFDDIYFTNQILLRLNPP